MKNHKGKLQSCQAAEGPLEFGGWARLWWNNSSNWAEMAIRANHIRSSSLIIHSWMEGSVEVLDKWVFRAVPLLTTAWEWLFMCECQRIWHDRLESKNSALKEITQNGRERIGFQRTTVHWHYCFTGTNLSHLFLLKELKVRKWGGGMDWNHK